MSAQDILRQRNGMATTQTVLDKQQSGVDAVQKANPQEVAQGPQAAPGAGVQQTAQTNTNTQPVVQQGASFTPQQRSLDAMMQSDDDQKGFTPDNTKLLKQSIENGGIPDKVRPEPKPMTYTEMFKKINGKGDFETPEQKAAREKRERRNARIAAIGDGIRALSDMFFASKGARVVHNPQTDLTAVQQKRRQMLDEQREKNKQTWLNGYMKAQALDEEAKKNNLTLAEQVRYHDMIADNNKEKNDLSQQRIDLSRYRLKSMNDYNDKKLQIEKDYKDGLLSEKAKENAISQLNADANMLRAKKSGNGRSSSASTRNGSYSGNVEDYITLKEQDPQGMAEAEAEARRMHYSPKTASGKAAARVIYRRKHAKNANKGRQDQKGASGEKWASGLKL